MAHANVAAPSPMPKPKAFRRKPVHDLADYWCHIRVPGNCQGRPLGKLGSRRVPRDQERPLLRRGPECMGLYENIPCFPFLPCVVKITAWHDLRSLPLAALGCQEHIERWPFGVCFQSRFRPNHATPRPCQAVVWRYPVLLPGDMKILQAVKLPVDAEYVPFEGIFLSPRDPGITDLGQSSDGLGDILQRERCRWPKLPSGAAPEAGITFGSPILGTLGLFS